MENEGAFTFRTVTEATPLVYHIVYFDGLAVAKWWWIPVMVIRVPYEVARIVVRGRGGVGWIPSWAWRSWGKKF